SARCATRSRTSPRSPWPCGGADPATRRARRADRGPVHGGRRRPERHGAPRVHGGARLARSEHARGRHRGRPADPGRPRAGAHRRPRGAREAAAGPVNGWLWAAAVLVAALVPLAVVCVRLPAPEGLVALEAAGVDAVLALLLISQGTGRQPFGD